MFHGLFIFWIALLGWMPESSSAFTIQSSLDAHGKTWYGLAFSVQDGIIESCGDGIQDPVDPNLRSCERMARKIFFNSTITTPDGPLLAQHEIEFGDAVNQYRGTLLGSGPVHATAYTSHVFDSREPAAIRFMRLARNETVGNRPLLAPSVITSLLEEHQTTLRQQLQTLSTVHHHLIQRVMQPQKKTENEEDMSSSSRYDATEQYADMVRYNQQSGKTQDRCSETNGMDVSATKQSLSLCQIPAYAKTCEPPAGGIPANSICKRACDVGGDITSDSHFTFDPLPSVHQCHTVEQQIAQSMAEVDAALQPNPDCTVGSDPSKCSIRALVEAAGTEINRVHEYMKTKLIPVINDTKNSVEEMQFFLNQQKDTWEKTEKMQAEALGRTQKDADQALQRTKNRTIEYFNDFQRKASAALTASSQVHFGEQLQQQADFLRNQTFEMIATANETMSRIGMLLASTDQIVHHLRWFLRSVQDTYMNTRVMRQMATDQSSFLQSILESAPHLRPMAQECEGPDRKACQSLLTAAGAGRPEGADPVVMFDSSSLYFASIVSNAEDDPDRSEAWLGALPNYSEENAMFWIRREWRIQCNKAWLLAHRGQIQTLQDLWQHMGQGRCWIDLHRFRCSSPHVNYKVPFPTSALRADLDTIRASVPEPIEYVSSFERPMRLGNTNILCPTDANMYKDCTPGVAPDVNQRKIQRCAEERIFSLDAFASELDMLFRQKRVVVQAPGTSEANNVYTLLHEARQENDDDGYIWFYSGWFKEPTQEESTSETFLKQYRDARMRSVQWLHVFHGLTSTEVMASVVQSATITGWAAEFRTHNPVVMEQEFGRSMVNAYFTATPAATIWDAISSSLERMLETNMNQWELDIFGAISEQTRQDTVDMLINPWDRIASTFPSRARASQHTQSLGFVSDSWWPVTRWHLVGQSQKVTHTIRLYDFRTGQLVTTQVNDLSPHVSRIEDDAEAIMPASFVFFGYWQCALAPEGCTFPLGDPSKASHFVMDVPEHHLPGVNAPLESRSSSPFYPLYPANSGDRHGISLDDCLTHIVPSLDGQFYECATYENSLRWTRDIGNVTGWASIEGVRAPDPAALSVSLAEYAVRVFRDQRDSLHDPPANGILPCMYGSFDNVTKSCVAAPWNASQSGVASSFSPLEWTQSRHGIRCAPPLESLVSGRPPIWKGICAVLERGRVLAPLQTYQLDASTTLPRLTNSSDFTPDTDRTKWCVPQSYTHSNDPTTQALAKNFVWCCSNFDPLQLAHPRCWQSGFNVSALGYQSRMQFALKWWKSTVRFAIDGVNITASTSTVPSTLTKPMCNSYQFQWNTHIADPIRITSTVNLSSSSRIVLFAFSSKECTTQHFTEAQRLVASVTDMDVSVRSLPSVCPPSSNNHEPFWYASMNVGGGGGGAIRSQPVPSPCVHLCMIAMALDISSSSSSICWFQAGGGEGTTTTTTTTTQSPLGGYGSFPSPSSFHDQVSVLTDTIQDQISSRTTISITRQAAIASAAISSIASRLRDLRNESRVDVARSTLQGTLSLLISIVSESAAETVRTLGQVIIPVAPSSSSSSTLNDLMLDFQRQSKEIQASSQRVYDKMRDTSNLFGELKTAIDARMKRWQTFQPPMTVAQANMRATVDTIHAKLPPAQLQRLQDMYKGDAKITVIGRFKSFKELVNDLVDGLDVGLTFLIKNAVKALKWIAETLTCAVSDTLCHLGDYIIYVVIAIVVLIGLCVLFAWMRARKQSYAMLAPPPPSSI